MGFSALREPRFPWCGFDGPAAAKIQLVSVLDETRLDVRFKGKQLFGGSHHHRNGRSCKDRGCQPAYGPLATYYRVCPIVALFEAMSIIIVMTGTATTPLITRREKPIAAPARVARKALSHVEIADQKSVVLGI
jgi:hypothetical protein